MLNQENLTGTTLASRLKKAMREAEISNGALAEIAGVSIQAVGEWLRTGQIAREKLPAVARAVNKSIDWLLTEQETIQANRNSSIDVGVFTRAIGDFEAAALSAKKKLSPEIKAEAIALLYENYLAAGKSDSNAARRILRLVK